jgi:hypothetical protein
MTSQFKYARVVQDLANYIGKFVATDPNNLRHRHFSLIKSEFMYLLGYITKYIIKNTQTLSKNV